MLVPLALAQFVCSFAGSNMNVSINSIAKDLGTDVGGVQIAITLFLLVMAALMIPGSKLTDRAGRKRCLVGGLVVYGTGAVVAAIAPGLGVLILGYSALQGIGSALLIRSRRPRRRVAPAEGIPPFRGVGAAFARPASLICRPPRARRSPRTDQRRTLE